MEFEYTQDEVAIKQLNQAIRLFLDEEDYFSSATLAGAAEEIFGSMLRIEGRKASLDVEADRISLALTDAERDALKTKKGERNGIVNILNSQRNWLKHHKEEDFTNFSDPKREARDLIDRAVINYMELKDETTDEINRFRVYQQSEF